jgi:hypothetical protein
LLLGEGGDLARRAVAAELVERQQWRWLELLPVAENGGREGWPGLIAEEVGEGLEAAWRERRGAPAAHARALPAVGL